MRTGRSSPIGSVAAAVARGDTTAVSMVAEALDWIHRPWEAAYPWPEAAPGDEPFTSGLG